MKKIFLFILITTLILVPIAITRAQFGGALENLHGAVDDTGLSSDFAGSVSTVVKGILALVGTIFFLLTIYAGILWMTARGDEGKVEKAIDIIRASIIGLIVTLSAYAITFFVTNRLSGATSGGQGSGTKFTSAAECAKQTTTDSCVKSKCYWVEKLPVGETVHCKSFQ